MLQNLTDDVIVLAYRGPAVVDVSLGPHGSREIELEAGAYLVAGSPSNPNASANFRNEFRIRPGAYTQALADEPDEENRPR